MAQRTPRELIDLYWFEVWNNGQIELIREICADPMVRHTAGPVERLGHDAQIARVRKNIAEFNPRFTHEVLIADDTCVSSVWNMRTRSDRIPRMCGIETFRVADGRLAECWNPPYGYALWDDEQ